jgi:antitoxin HigA-1
MAAMPIHPGERLAEELRELGMSAAELARNLDVPTNRITGILNGQRAITGDTALRLGHFFGMSPQFWLNLQSLYALRLAQERAGRAIRALPRLRNPEHVRAWRHGRRNATIVSWAVITTYCFPSLPRYVIGFAIPFAGSFVSHSSFPVFDSYA